MIKITLYFGNPAYLKTRDEQLLIVLPDGGSGLAERERSTTIPIEDIGIVILDHQQITIPSNRLRNSLETLFKILHMMQGVKENPDIECTHRKIRAIQIRNAILQFVQPTPGGFFIYGEPKWRNASALDSRIGYWPTAATKTRCKTGRC